MGEISPLFKLQGSPAEIRGRIMKFEDDLRKCSAIRAELPVVQYFCDGVYMRELHMPAGTLLTGKIHKRACLNIVLTGEVEVVTDQGARIVRGPLVFESPGGIKRAGRVISDTIWITVHANPDDVERDSDAMVDLLTVPSFEALELYERKRNED